MEYNPTFVPGTGPPDAELMIVGEAPGEEEDSEGRPFSANGRSGKLARELISQAGGKWDDCYITNVEKYRPPQNKLSLYKSVGRKPFQDIEILRSEIATMQPKTILALGEHAFKATTGKKGIKKWRGSILPCNFDHSIKVVGTYHPSALLRSETSETKVFSYSARAYITNDIRRAINQSKFRDFRLPKREYEYATCYADAKRFFDLYRNFKIVSVDIETTKGTCIPTCIGFAFNAYHGMSIPLLNIDSRVAIDDREQARLIQLVQEVLLDPELKIVGQNFKFDWKKLVRPFAFNIQAQLYFDTGMAAHILYPEFPKSMQFLTSVWTEEPYYKDELKEWDPDKEDFHTILLYNAKDVCVPFEIYSKMLAELEERKLDRFFFDKIMPLSHFYMDMENRGINYDSGVHDRVLAQYQLLEKELINSLNGAAGYEFDKDLGSYRKVRHLLFDELQLPTRKNTKDDTLVGLLPLIKDNNLRAYSIISDLLELRKVRRTINGPLKSPPDYDGRMRSICNINGAAIGRTSFNIVKPPERPTKLGLQFQNLTKHGDIGSEMREELKPDPGKVFVQVDMSQADARVVAALAKDEFRLEVFRLGKDMHSITASWYFGKEDPEHPMDPIGVDPIGERFIGKSTGHAIAYFCKWKTLQLTINKLARKFHINITVNAAECKEFIRIFLAKSPNIEHVFWKEVIGAINKHKRTLTAASGRTRQFFGLWDPNLYYSYIPAASVTDHNKFSAVECKNRIPQLEILKEDHDSFMFQATLKDAEDYRPIIQEIYETPMDLSRCSLPRDPIIIPCDFEIGENYKDMRKWKK